MILARMLVLRQKFATRKLKSASRVLADSFVMTQTLLLITFLRLRKVKTAAILWAAIYSGPIRTKDCRHVQAHTKSELPSP